MSCGLRWLRWRCPVFHKFEHEEMSNGRWRWEEGSREDMPCLSDRPLCCVRHIRQPHRRQRPASNKGSQTRATLI